MKENQEKIYREYVENYKRKKEKFGILELLTNLKTITLFPDLLREKKGRAMLGTKMEYILEYLEEKKEPLIIFSTRSNTFLVLLSEILKKKKILFGMIIGKMSAEEKEKAIQNFKKGIINVLLCNIQSANLGLDLSSAETIIFADRSYSYADNKQAESRFISPQENQPSNTKLIIDLICINSIDEKIISILENKKNFSKFIKDNHHEEIQKFFLD